MFSKSKRFVMLTALLLAIPANAHADVEHQGPLTVLVTGATVSAPAVRVVIPLPPPPLPRTTQEMIRDVWPDNLEERALRIAYRESRYQCCVRTFCCFGVFQIYLSVHREWLNEMGIYTKEDLYDPLTNIKAAYHLYELDGWSPWQT